MGRKLSCLEEWHTVTSQQTWLPPLCETWAQLRQNASTQSPTVEEAEDISFEGEGKENKT